MAGNLLKLTYVVSGNDSLGSESVYQIEILRTTEVIFRYPNSKLTGTYKRIK
jgi:hypothetical protein